MNYNDIMTPVMALGKVSVHMVHSSVGSTWKEEKALSLVIPWERDQLTPNSNSISCLLSKCISHSLSLLPIPGISYEVMKNIALK